MNSDRDAVATIRQVSTRTWFALLDRRSEHRLAIDGAVVVMTAIALVIEGGLVGVAVAAMLALAWLMATVPIAFAIGQAGAVIGLGGDPTTMPLTQIGLFAVLATGLLGADMGAAARALGVFGTATAVLLALLVVIESTLTAAAVTALVVATALYVLHRYELLALGLLEAAG